MNVPMEKWNTRLHLERKQEVEPSGSMSTVTLPPGKHRDRFLPPTPFPAAIIRAIGRSSQKRKVWASPRVLVLSCNFDFSQSCLARLPFGFSSEAPAGNRRLRHLAEVC